MNLDSRTTSYSLQSTQFERNGILQCPRKITSNLIKPNIIAKVIVCMLCVELIVTKANSVNLDRQTTSYSLQSTQKEMEIAVPT